MADRNNNTVKKSAGNPPAQSKNAGSKNPETENKPSYEGRTRPSGDTQRIQRLSQVGTPAQNSRRSIRIEKNLNPSFWRRLNNSFSVAAIGAVIAVIAIIIISVVVISATYKNSLLVEINGQEMGYVFDKKVTAKDLLDSAIAKREAALGAVIQSHDIVTVIPAKSKKTEQTSAEYMIGLVSNALHFEVEAASIVVNGSVVAVVQTPSDAGSVLDEIKQAYYQEGLNIVDSGFVEDVKVEPKFVELAGISTREKALGSLTTIVDAQKSYEIKSGDSLWKIANDFSMTVDDLLRLNPTYTENSKLKPGDVLVLSIPVPFLSVITYERTEYSEVLPMQTETRQNPDQPRSYSKVIQQGRDGKLDVTADIVRINGFYERSDIVLETVALEPIVQIIEVGTKIR